MVITEKVSCIAAGSYHSVALTTSGKIYTWGYNGKFQLGRRSWVMRSVCPRRSCGTPSLATYQAGGGTWEDCHMDQSLR